MSSTPPPPSYDQVQSAQNPPPNSFGRDQEPPSYASAVNYPNEQPTHKVNMTSQHQPQPADVISYSYASEPRFGLPIDRSDYGRSVQTNTSYRQAPAVTVSLNFYNK